MTTPGMNLYSVTFDNCTEFVEAADFASAIALWREHNVENNDMDDWQQPESVTLVSESPVIRAS